MRGFIFLLKTLLPIEGSSVEKSEFCFQTRFTYGGGQQARRVPAG